MSPPVQQMVITGVVTATNGGGPVADANVEFGTAIATTDPRGRFSLTIPSLPSADTPFVVRGPGLIRRELFAPPADQLTLDVIRDADGFDLEFYRELVRNALETSGGLFALTRWAANPRVVVRTVDEAGAPVDTAVVDAAASLVAAAVNTWTGGLLTASIAKGEPRGGADEIVVRWLDGSHPGTCGKAVVGGTEMYINPVSPTCRCSGFPVSPAGVRHELGHVLGFWHTDSPGDVMYGQANPQACARDVSDRERRHAAIAYRRQIGNTDLDSDPPIQVRPAAHPTID